MKNMTKTGLFVVHKIVSEHAEKAFKLIYSAESIERDSVARFFASGFFHESVSPQPQSIQLGPFEFFSKIPGDIL
jgi:hypothetical protein